MKVLVTGGAGYIGSTVVSALLDAGDEVVVLDDLSRGEPAFLAGVAHVVGDVGDRADLARVFAEHPDIAAAVHCAARTVVGESLVDPLGYYLENVAKTIVLLQALVEYGCPRVVFTSSAAVYGPDVTGSVGESAPLLAATPYARSKVMIEEVLTDACAALPLTAVSLRCFNPIGSDPKLRSGPYDDAPTHALGQLLLARSSGESFRIHGTDWPTADGTPVRDFVHVWDVALAHVAAVHIELPESGAAHRIVNVGSGHATTVRELAAAFNQYAEPPITVELGPRRAGDGVGSASSVAAAAELLDWHPTLSVTDAVLDVLRWIERHGLGRDPGCA